MNRRAFLARSWKALLAAHVLSFALQREALAALAKGARNFFSNAEIETFGAYFDTLIPRSKKGPSASEAGVMSYVGKIVADELPRWRRLKGIPVSSTGSLRFYHFLARRLDALAQEKYAHPFAKLSPEQRVERVSTLAKSTVKQVGYAVASGIVDEGVSDLEVFRISRNHVLQGYFADPKYGGNAGYRPWESIQHICHFNYSKENAACQGSQ